MKFKKRGKDFWVEFELYLADLLVGLVVNVALVGMLAPYARSLFIHILLDYRHKYRSLFIHPTPFPHTTCVKAFGLNHISAIGLVDHLIV